jgi:phosphoesterase RecJ-like protein
VLDSLEVSADGRVACVTTMRDDLREFASGKDALEGFINYPRSIVGVEVAVSFREEEGGVFRVSFRSKGRVDVSAVAARFDGGGHRNAAGCTVPGALPDVKKRVLEALGAVLS